MLQTQRGRLLGDYDLQLYTKERIGAVLQKRGPLGRPSMTRIRIQPSSYIIGLFDVLGFEKRVRRTNLTKIYGEYKELLDAVGRRDSRLLVAALPTKENPSVSVASLSSHIIEHTYFSDTIIVWSVHDPIRADSFLGICADLLCESILLKLPLRGAISFGPAFMQKNEGIFMGKPIVEIAQLEKVQNWIGATLGPSLHKKPHSFDPHYVIPYRRHIKSKSKFSVNLVIDWPRFWRENYNDDLLSHLCKMRPAGDGRDKYDLTMEFVRYSQNNNDWWMSKGSTLSGY